MRECRTLLFFDRQDHTWRFYVKDNGELVYSIMYEEDKWTKESKIDIEVLDFTVNIDRELKVFIIYSNKTGELKYCIWENNQWFGKTLYIFDHQGYQISQLSVNIIEKYMHILLIAKINNKKGQCSLMHFCFNNEEELFDNVYNISFMQEAYSYYQTEVLKDGSLYLLLMQKQENEIAIKATSYKDGKWNILKRLYGINGSQINFCSLYHNNKISILNFSKDNSMYSLEHVMIDVDGKMKSNNIREGSLEFKNCVLIGINNLLWAMWSEGENFFTSTYNGRWSEPILYGHDVNEAVLTYRYLSQNKKYKDFEIKYVLGTIPPEIKLLLPEHKNNQEAKGSLINNENHIVKILEHKDESKLNIKEENNLNIKDEFMVLKKTNKNLEKRVIDLQLQHQQKQRIIEESDDNFVKLTNAKKKAEEKLKIITEVQQLILKEVEELKKQKIDRDNVEGALKSKLQRLSSENQQLKVEVEDIRKQKMTKENLVGELKNKLKELNIENEQMRIELKYENTKGIMHRILKKKIDR